jgi:hypothetical protein
VYTRYGDIGLSYPKALTTVDNYGMTEAMHGWNGVGFPISRFHYRYILICVAWMQNGKILEFYNTGHFTALYVLPHNFDVYFCS